MTTTTNTFRATFARLRSGDWGVRVVGTLPAEGTAVPVHKRSGSATTKTLGAIAWRGVEDDGTPVALYTIAEDRRTPPPPAMPPAAPEAPADRELDRLREQLLAARGDVQRLTFALEYVLRSERDFGRYLPEAVRDTVAAALGVGPARTLLEPPAPAPATPAPAPAPRAAKTSKRRPAPAKGRALAEGLVDDDELPF